MYLPGLHYECSISAPITKFATSCNFYKIMCVTMYQTNLCRFAFISYHVTNKNKTMNIFLKTNHTLWQCQWPMRKGTMFSIAQLVTSDVCSSSFKNLKMVYSLSSTGQYASPQIFSNFPNIFSKLVLCSVCHLLTLLGSHSMCKRSSREMEQLNNLYGPKNFQVNCW